tara:strand:- start:167 stop:355 length:189 start_codon:yes stop_codon:yes gene_type:complete
MDNELTPFEKTHLKFLKNQEHQYQNESQRTNFEHPNVNQDWDRARRELKEYVKELREKGRNI